MNVMLIDDTLREGLQTPRLAFTMEEKLKLAEAISKAGIDVAIVSYPPAHISEFEVTKAIVERKYFKEIYGLGRATIEDIEIIDKTGANIAVHLPFIIENPEKIYNALKYAVDKGKKVDVGIVGISRQSLNSLEEMVKNIEKINVDSVQISDSYGEMVPSKSEQIIKFVKNIFTGKVSVHFHNDWGAALVNSIVSILSGADCIDTTILGIGERNGIADTASAYMILKNEGFKVHLDLEKLREAYEILLEMLVSKIGYQFLFYNLPVFGKNTAIHTAGTHAAFSNIFSGQSYSFNVYTGKHMVKNFLESKGIHLSDENLESLVKKIKDISVEKGLPVKEDEILRMVGDLKR